ncbi:hypothetical protein GZL_08468 [Streptomyces sp. 769]|nr:hypothetical protein GZL_08468 [Streptomyces sp. 769]
MGFEVQLKLLHLAAVIRIAGVPLRQVLADPEQFTDIDPQAGLLPHFTAGCLGSSLTGLDAPARQHVELSAVVAVPDEQDPARLIHHDSAGTDPRLGEACGRLSAGGRQRMITHPRSLRSPRRPVAAGLHRRDASEA